eukprot:SAG22_NODE_398_length_11106_cov_67.829836_10_plen_331_part_00
MNDTTLMPASAKMCSTTQPEEELFRRDRLLDATRLAILTGTRVPPPPPPPPPGWRSSEQGAAKPDTMMFATHVQMGPPLPAAGKRPAADKAGGTPEPSPGAKRQRNRRAVPAEKTACAGTKDGARCGREIKLQSNSSSAVTQAHREARNAQSVGASGPPVFKTRTPDAAACRREWGAGGFATAARSATDATGVCEPELEEYALFGSTTAGNYAPEAAPRDAIFLQAAAVEKPGRPAGAASFELFSVDGYSSDSSSSIGSYDSDDSNTSCSGGQDEDFDALLQSSEWVLPSEFLDAGDGSGSGGHGKEEQQSPPFSEPEDDLPMMQGQVCV